MKSFNDMESNNIETEETLKTTLFTLKNVAVAVGNLGCFGTNNCRVTCFLRSGLKSPNQSELAELKKSEENDVSDQVQSINLVFDVISSSTPYWIPFSLVTHYTVSFQSKPTTRTYLNTRAVQIIDGFNPKLQGPQIRHLCVQKDIDNRSFITDRIVYHEDLTFRCYWEKSYKGDELNVVWMELLRLDVITWKWLTPRCCYN